LTAFTTGTERFWNGPTHPFQRNGKGDFSTASGIDQLRAAIEQLLMTRGPDGQEVGELPWDTERGSRIHTLLHSTMPIETMQHVAGFYTAEVLRKYEPRIQLRGVKVERFASSNQPEDPHKNFVKIRVLFTPRAAGALSATVEEAQVVARLEQ